MTPLGGARRHLEMSGRVIRAVLRSPALRRVELAFLLFNTVEFGTWVAILLYAYEATGPASVGVVALVQLLPAAIVAPVAASLADRYPRDRVLFVGYVVQALAFAVTAVGMLAGWSPLLVYAAGGVAASSLTFTRPAQGALLPSLSRTPEELTAANGLSGTVEGTGMLLGPLAAAVILVVASPGAVFAAGCAGAAFAAVLVARLPRPESRAVDPGDFRVTGSIDVEAAAHGHDHEQDDGRRHEDDHRAESPTELVSGGLRILATNGDTRLVVALLALRMLTTGAMDVLFVLLALEVFGTGESGAAILNVALGLGVAVGGAASFALVGRRRLAPAMALAALVWGLALIVVGTVAPAWLAPAVIALGAIGLAACDVAGRTILQRVTDDRMLARVLGGLEGIGMAALAVGSVLVAALAAAWGPANALLAVGLIMPAGVALAWRGLRAIDRRVRVPEREVALLREAVLFAPLAPPQLESVAGRTRWVTLETGGLLIREGDPGDRYFVLETGVLDVTRGGRHLNRMSGRGTGVGEIALLHNVPRTATVRAAGPCVLLSLERADFLGAVTGREQAREAADRTSDGRREPQVTTAVDLE